jgi:hypothetical protein
MWQNQNQTGSAKQRAARSISLVHGGSENEAGGIAA